MNRSRHLDPPEDSVHETDAKQSATTILSAWTSIGNTNERSLRHSTGYHLLTRNRRHVSSVVTTKFATVQTLQCGTASRTEEIRRHILSRSTITMKSPVNKACICEGLTSTKGSNFASADRVSCKVYDPSEAPSRCCDMRSTPESGASFNSSAMEDAGLCATHSFGGNDMTPLVCLQNGKTAGVEDVGG